MEAGRESGGNADLPPGGGRQGAWDPGALAHHTALRKHHATMGCPGIKSASRGGPQFSALEYLPSPVTGWGQPHGTEWTSQHPAISSSTPRWESGAHTAATQPGRRRLHSAAPPSTQSLSRERGYCYEQGLDLELRFPAGRRRLLARRKQLPERWGGGRPDPPRLRADKGLQHDEEGL